MDKTCAVTGCDNTGHPDNKTGTKYLRRGMCHMHYSRWWRNGDPTYDGIAAYSQARKAKRAEQAGRSDKKCSVCNKTKPLSEYYKRGEWFYTWCKACHKDKMDAKRIEQQLAKPKRTPVDHGNCSFDGCTNKGKTQLVRKGGPEGWYCNAHYSQWHTHQELKPLNPTAKSYINDRFRRCTSCQKVKTHESFNLRSTRAGRQSECKDCNYLRARFNLLMREGGREDEVQELYDRMPPVMQDKLKARLEAA